MLRWVTVLGCAALLTGCASPYRPPVPVHGGQPFQGIAGLIEQNASRQVDVLLVHGMCTHTRSDATSSIEKLAAAMGANITLGSHQDKSVSDVVSGIEV